MRAILVLLGLAALVLVVLMSLGFVSLEQTQQASITPPEFKADVGRIDVGTSNRTIEVPTIEVEKADPAPADPAPAPAQ
ncbi:hypothetical protein [Sphingomonas japonica]|uniref:Uncharacterized protein n=1 Tax=Sphingomonas japonica TaxID=511662 RepID=A0ABX0U060_9SPHN|nr:hypothetical protein [Sphingomonas japonica]NIJ23878.1 hypothetical protein [Sphingomonas japonica]